MRAGVFRVSRPPRQEASVPPSVDHPYLGRLCSERILYSQFINGLVKAQIELDRKQLSEMAISGSSRFTAVVEKAKAALDLK